MRKIKNKIINKVDFEIKNEVKDENHILTLSGPISSHNYYYDSINVQTIKESLEGSQAKNLIIKLNSPGGDVFAGIELKNYLEDLDMNVTVEVTALAASAASVMILGADKIIMREGASIMIHEASTIAYGTKSDIQKTMNALETIDKSLVEMYVNKTGLSKEEISDMLKAETWLTGEEAVKKGFADSFIESVDDKADITNLQLQIVNLKNEIEELKNKSEIIEEVIEQPIKVVANNRRRFF